MNYARVAVYKVTQGSVAELIAKARNELYPQLKALPGFVAYELSEADGELLVSMSSWRSRAQAEAAITLIEAWSGANLRGRISRLAQYTGDIGFSSRTPEAPRPTAAHS